jgi:integrase
MARPSTGQIVERRGTRGTTYAARFRAYGKRRYVTLDVTDRTDAQTELENILAVVRRGIWREPGTVDAVDAVEEPTLHVLASEWLERRRHEVDARTVEHWRWALSNHLLPFFADYRPSEVTVAAVEKFKTAKLAERERRLAAIGEWGKKDPKARGRMPARSLSNASINKCLKVLAQVLDEAVQLGYVDANVARPSGGASRPTSRGGRGSNFTRCRRSSPQPSNTGRSSRQ